jgi:hypothetical protein
MDRNLFSTLVERPLYIEIHLVVGFFGREKVGKAFSFCSTPKTGLVDVLGVYRVTRLGEFLPLGEFWFGIF